MKVLLVADVGRTDYGFYHVGDEAMFYETVRWYSKNRPLYAIGALSRSTTRKNLRVKEYQHLSFPPQDWTARKYLFKLIIKNLLFKFTGIIKFNSVELNFVQLVQKYDLIHFCGGGNFYSISVSWLYYAFYIIFLGKIYGKTTILTSQTIGPFRGIDKIFVPIFLNMPKLIGVREPSDDITLYKHRVIRPKVISMIDKAYTLPSIKSTLVVQTKKTKIGLSLHRWQGVEDNMINIVLKALNEIAKTKDIEVFIIPHIIVKADNDWDNLYMSQIISKLNKQIKVKIVKYSDLTKSKNEPACLVKHITSKMDVLISSRYHGLVFALSENVPCMSFSMGEYYKSKNEKALKFWYGERYSDYIFSLENYNPTLFTKKLNSILEDLPKQKLDLKVANQKLSSSKSIFNLQGVLEITKC